VKKAFFVSLVICSWLCASAQYWWLWTAFTFTTVGYIWTSGSYF